MARSGVPFVDVDPHNLTGPRGGRGHTALGELVVDVVHANELLRCVATMHQ